MPSPFEVDLSREPVHPCPADLPLVVFEEIVISFILRILVYDLIFVGPLDFENSAPHLKQILRA